MQIISSILKQHVIGLLKEFFGAHQKILAEIMHKTNCSKRMDLADASLITALEELHTNRVFTLDNNDFPTYRIKKGYRNLAVRIIC